MDVPSTSNIVLSTSQKDSTSVQICGQSGDLTNKKRKRSLSKENVENTEETPAGKRVRKSRSKKYKNLPAEAAEEKRRRVNQQERLRQKQIAEAIQRLKNLNLPFNPNVPNHKRDSTMYTISTATDLIIALRKKCKDNGIDPDLLELPSQSQGSVSEQQEAESSNNDVQSVAIKTSQSSAQDLATGPNHFICGDILVPHDETRTRGNYPSSNHNVPQCSNKLVDVSNRQQYPCGNGIMFPQNKQITQTYGYQTVPGVYPGAHIFMAPFNFGPYNSVPLQVHPMTRRALNGCIDMTGHHDVTSQSSQSQVNSVPPACTPTHMTNYMPSTPCLSEDTQADALFGTPSFVTTTPLQPATTTITSSSDISQHDIGNFEREFSQWLWQ